MSVRWPATVILLGAGDVRLAQLHSNGRIVAHPTFFPWSTRSTARPPPSPLQLDIMEVLYRCAKGLPKAEVEGIIRKYLPSAEVGWAALWLHLPLSTLSLPTVEQHAQTTMAPLTF